MTRAAFRFLPKPADRAVVIVHDLRFVRPPLRGTASMGTVESMRDQCRKGQRFDRPATALPKGVPALKQVRHAQPGLPLAYGQVSSPRISGLRNPPAHA